MLVNVLAGLASIKHTGSEHDTGQVDNPIGLCMAAESAMSLTTPINVLPFHFCEPYTSRIWPAPTISSVGIYASYI